jgi:hypothetical protein
MRMVTHLNVDRQDIPYIAEVMSSVLKSL